MLKDIYNKYKVDQDKETSNLTPLSFILRKAEIGENLTESEWSLLDQKQLIETKKIIKNQEDYRDTLLEELRTEFLRLMRTPLLYNSIKKIPWIADEKALILYKVNVHERLTYSELQLVDNHYHSFLNFIDNKKKSGIIEDIPNDKDSEKILSKLVNEEPLSAANIKWLYSHKAYSFLSRNNEQLSQLQNKYKVIFKEGTSTDLLSLFYLLQKLNENSTLDQDEINYLKDNGFNETLEIIQQLYFSRLKEKYKATEIQDNSVTHHLYKVLKKLDAELPLAESDINYLKKRKLRETVKFIYKKEADSLIKKIELGHKLRPDDIVWCKEYGYEEIILKCLQKEFNVKSDKYTPDSPLYTILGKLEKGKRLNDEEVIWLEGEKLLNPSSKVYIRHHTLEALYYENEFQRIRDHWKLASASAHWRKAEKPKQALSLTDTLNFKKIKPEKLRAALFTTRGGALRDIGETDEAVNCALAAIEQFSDSHNPYTLMGALCYDRGDYSEGDKWFEEAVKRGAKLRDQDAEIKRILRKKSNQKLIDHLLKKDPKRFAWVNRFAHKSRKRKF